MRLLVLPLAVAAFAAHAAGSSGGEQDSAARIDAQGTAPDAMPVHPAGKTHVHEARAHAMRTQRGKASIYARKFANRKMANGRRMNPQTDNAASKTLPLGTKAEVKNLETGKTAVVTIEDRGPYVRGRIVDLSPSTAEKIGLDKKQGIAPVEVRPIAPPQEAGQGEFAEND